MKIDRNPEASARKQYDLIVIGGGGYGAMIALEAALRGCAVLTLEKEDFGGATSYNSLRIIHGGLRDLQTLNLRRYWEFGRERRWFLEHFPNLVERLPVLVPLYQRGLLRTDLFRVAFLLDRLLLPQRDREFLDDRFLPYGKVISASEVKQHFPQVEEHHLSGGALWYDACIPDSQRLIMEALRRACGMSATALNYMPAIDLLKDRNRVRGIRARDELSNTDYEFSADVVINAAGPWSQEVATSLDRKVSGLGQYSLAWNILFDQASPCDCALGVRPPTAGGQVHFLHPWKGRLLAGTGHASREQREENPRPSKEEINRHLEGLNEAVPALQLEPRDILHVYSGYLPVKQDGNQLVKKDRVIDHAKRGGANGLYSIVSTKLTAARSTAEKVVKTVFPSREITPAREKDLRRLRSMSPSKRGVYNYDWYPEKDDPSWRESMQEIIQEESVHHLDDLMLRRTSLGDNPIRALRLVPELCTLFDWDEGRCQEEVRRIENHFRRVVSSSKSHVSR